MKTWRTEQYLIRVSSLLIILGHPFHFDGSIIEFDATPEYIKSLEEQDPKLINIFNSTN